MVPEGTCREDKMVFKPRMLLLIVVIFARHWPLGFPKGGVWDLVCWLVACHSAMLLESQLFEEVESALAPTSVVAPQLDQVWAHLALQNL